VTADPNAPATKEDIRLLMEGIGKLYEANEQWKADIVEQIAASEVRTKEHFDLVAENLTHDFQSAFRDKLEQHEDRIVRLERDAGLRAA